MNGPVLAGVIGPSARQRVQEMARRLGGATAVLNEPEAVVHARGARALPQGRAVAWSHCPTADGDRSPEDVVIQVSPGRTALRGSFSGAIPVYVEADGDSLVFSSRLDALIESRTRALHPDWNGVAAMLAASGPHSGRTVVAEIRRLQPAESVSVQSSGTVAWHDEWDWPEVEPRHTTVSDLGSALAARLEALGDRHLVSLLSGGWDSRLLLAQALTRVEGADITAWTTSSDTGTVLEELVAAQVAEHTGVQHVLELPRRSDFATDLAEFAAAADYQTSFHIWLVPLARRLRTGTDSVETAPVVLDGLGGGLFVGDSFADSSSGSLPAEQRIRTVTRYLQSGPRVLDRKVQQALQDRVRADAEPVVHRYVDHPRGQVFTAYLTRTLAGISHAPHGLMAMNGPVVTPFVDDRVVRAALGLPLHAQDGDRLYPELMSRLDPHLTQIRTAQSQVPWPRPHPRRITSIEAITHLRSLILRDPIQSLLDPKFRRSDIHHWRRVLATTPGQHLIRGLAVLSIWRDEYAQRIAGLDVQELVR